MKQRKLTKKIEKCNFKSKHLQLLNMCNEILKLDDNCLI